MFVSNKIWLQKAGADKALRGADKMTKFARAANSLIVSIVRVALFQHVWGGWKQLMFRCTILKAATSF